MEQALIDALNAVIDARLIEIGLVEAPEAEPVATAAPAGKGGKAGKGKATKPTHTADECKEKLLELVQAQNKQAAVDLLSEFKAKKLTDIKVDQLDAFYAKLEEALAGEEGGGEDEELFA